MSSPVVTDPDLRNPAPARKRISRIHDARAVRSRGALRQALLALIEEKELGEITIREITARAGVSYPVFFRQFSSTENLLMDVATEQVRNLLGHTSDAFAPRGEGSLADMCAYVQAHRKLWTTLLTAGASATMRREFSRISEEIAASRPRTNPALPPDLVTELVTSAIFDILTWWLRQPADYPAANVVKLLEAFVIKVYSRRVRLDLE